MSGTHNSKPYSREGRNSVIGTSADPYVQELNQSDGHGRRQSAYKRRAGARDAMEDVSDIKTRTVNPLENDSSWDDSGSSFNASRSDIDVDYRVNPTAMVASHNIGMDFMKERTYNFGPDNEIPSIPVK